MKRVVREASSLKVGDELFAISPRHILKVKIEDLSGYYIEAIGEDGRAYSFYKKHLSSITMEDRKLIGADQITFEQAFKDFKTKPIAWISYSRQVNWITSSIEQPNELNHDFFTDNVEGDVNSWGKSTLERFFDQNFAIQSESRQQFFEYDLPTLIRMGKSLQPDMSIKSEKIDTLEKHVDVTDMSDGESKKMSKDIIGLKYIGSINDIYGYPKKSSDHKPMYFIYQNAKEFIVTEWPNPRETSLNIFIFESSSQIKEKFPQLSKELLALGL